MQKYKCKNVDTLILRNNYKQWNVQEINTKEIANITIPEAG